MSENLDMRFLNARKEYIRRQFQELNDMQQKGLLQLKRKAIAIYDLEALASSLTDEQPEQTL